MIKSPDLLRVGNLRGAIEAQTERVRASASDLDARVLLADLHCFSGAYEKADRQLEMCATLRSDFTVGVALRRQLVRAALARSEVFKDGRVPEFAVSPTPRLRASLSALASIRAGASHDARAELEHVQAADGGANGDRPSIVVNGIPSTDVRDGDDVCAPFLEVMTSTGKYFWIDWFDIRSLDLHSPKKWLDLLWRPAHLEVAGGPEGEVFIPMIYVSGIGPSEADDSFLLGQATEWSKRDEGPTRGVGLKMLIADDRAIGYDQLSELSARSSATGD